MILYNKYIIWDIFKACLNLSQYIYDIQHIFPGNCNYSDPEFCSNSTQGSICVWTDSQTCLTKEDLGIVSSNRTCISTVTGKTKSD
jgi:hypothetical protein